jgi:hypothetical protein
MAQFHVDFTEIYEKVKAAPLTNGNSMFQKKTTANRARTGYLRRPQALQSIVHFPQFALIFKIIFKCFNIILK